MARSTACTHGVNKRKLADGRCAACHSMNNKHYYQRNKERILDKAQKQREYITSLIKADMQKG